HEIAALPDGSRVGVICASDRGAENIAETLSIAGTKGIEIVSAILDDRERIEVVNRTADIILLSREALANGVDQHLDRQDRVRPWSYEFDPAGRELLRRGIEQAARAKASQGVHETATRREAAAARA